MKDQYSLFIGRWQPLTDGHKWLFNQRLKEGKKVCIAVRDVEPSENQPWTADEIIQNIKEEMYFEVTEDKVIIIKIPDIESINYGRGVGYEVIEHVPPDDIKEISATKVREQMRKDGKL
jgi:nicotinamide mononucleotide adenylyltransferase|tara:strand:- start:214 stop:570 length:357 start_codon:yes stop_codon:yes gene_type:complete